MKHLYPGIWAFPSSALIHNELVKGLGQFCDVSELGQTLQACPKESHISTADGIKDWLNARK